MTADFPVVPPEQTPLGGGAPVVAFRCEGLCVYVYRDRDTMGRAAARALAGRWRALAAQRGALTCVFAAAPSQDDVLRRLVADGAAPWDALGCVLHMDEYLRLPPTDPRSFRYYLDEHLFGPLRAAGRGPAPERIHLIRGDADDPEAERRRYADLVRTHPPDVVQGGIGEQNAHIAFNDPPDAAFDDPELVKIIELAPAAKQQQVNEGHYASADEIPRAFTLSVPALTGFEGHTVGYWSCVAPTAAKATAVERMLFGPVTEAVPASILRSLPASGQGPLPAAALFLDRDAAARLRQRLPGLEWGILG
jgi:glucosamine-6-phosphate deaminase